MKNIYIVLLSVLVLFALSGCESDFLDTNPTTSLSEETLKQTPEGVEGIIEGIHSMFYTYSFGQTFGNGAASLNTQLDFLGGSVINSAPAYYMGVYRWTDHRDPNGTINYRTWDFYYTLIQHCNTVLAITETLENVEPSFLNTLKGEAHIIRAYAYNQLTQLFGKRFVKGGDNSSLGVILRITPNIDPMPRSTVAECYAQINKDVEDAIKELTAGKDLKRKNRISLATAYGIAARTALAQHDFVKAELYSKEAIAKFSGQLQAGNKLVDGFNDFKATEWMWGYTQAADQNMFYAGYGAQYAYNFPSHSRSLRFAINRSYYDKMGDNDVRRKWFVALDRGDIIPQDAAAPYFDGGVKNPKWEVTGQCIKFKTVANDKTIMDNSLMRLGEMYYILAEAQAQQNRLVDAAKTLENVMKTRDPEYVANISLTKSEMIDEVLRNKKIDLYWEGLDFFDMKRLSKMPDRLNSGNDKYMNAQQLATFQQRNSGTNVAGMPTDVNDKVWEFVIPYDEIKGNKLCEQNPL